MTDLVWIAVSGGRYYSDYAHVKRVLDEERPGVVVQGECPTPSQGADGLAKRWCRENGVPCIGVEALWKFYGKPAGPIRNGWMFSLLPIYKLIAFPGDRGTANAVEQAIEREICVRDEREKSNAASDLNGQASAPLSDEAGHAPEVSR